MGTLAFLGTLQKFQDVFGRLNIKAVPRQLPDKVRFEIGSVYVDWWPMSKGKTVYVNGSPPVAVVKVQQMLAREFQRMTVRPQLIPGLIKSIEEQGGQIVATDKRKIVSFRARNIPATFTVEDTGACITAVAVLLRGRGGSPQTLSDRYEVKAGQKGFGPFMKNFIAMVRAVGGQSNAVP